MQNKYLINFSKKFWFWFWTKLMNGFAPSDLQGNYRRPSGILINKNYEFKNHVYSLKRIVIVFMRFYEMGIDRNKKLSQLIKQELNN